MFPPTTAAQLKTPGCWPPTGLALLGLLVGVDSRSIRQPLVRLNPMASYRAQGVGTDIPPPLIPPVVAVGGGEEGENRVEGRVVMVDMSNPKGPNLYLTPVGSWELHPLGAGPHSELCYQVSPPMVQIGPGVPPQGEYCAPKIWPGVPPLGDWPAARPDETLTLLHPDDCAEAPDPATEIWPGVPPLEGLACGEP